MKLKLALAASAALNLFVVGTVVGALATSAKAAREQGQPRGPTVWSAAQSLPEPARSGLRRIVQAQVDAVRPVIREARSKRRVAFGLITANSFDAPAIAGRLAEARATEAKVRDQLDEAVLAYVATLPPDQRARLAGPLAASRVGRPDERRR